MNNEQKPYEGMDGLKRNLARFKYEWIMLWHYMKPHWKRYLRKPWDSHAYTNLYVESRRHAPYLIGHFDAVFYPLLLALLFFF